MPSAAAATSGDAAGACILPDGRMAFILSDGMGKGMKAAAESQAVVRGLSRLLKKGVAPSRAIKIVNRELIGENCWTSSRGEMFATVDLLLVDKERGRAHFYKMGAATSYIVRNQSVKKVEQAALPIGIVNKVRARQMAIKLFPGDVLVMVSDGITEADRSDLEAKWLQDYLADVKRGAGPRVMASKIAKLAESKYFATQKDDISVIVIQIK
ncbi:MAG: SpoIIE family protein phosphatase [Firmicutes bacterium]|nr:SpoIIE family protein phosphatase [Bacillota bacterium]